MAKQQGNNIKLGAFVLTGLGLLILSFFLIGKNNNIFGSDFSLRVRFSSLSGLTEGNNVLFSGIQAGTVKKIEMLNDTSIEVTMRITNKIKPYIHSNAVASIGTEGLMGNKVINISPTGIPSPLVFEGALLPAKKMAGMDEILQTLSGTNNNVAAISQVLKGTVMRVDKSSLLKLIEDPQIALQIKSSLESIQQASVNTRQMSSSLNDMISDIRAGKGSLGVLLSDTSSAAQLRSAIASIDATGKTARKMGTDMESIINSLEQDVKNGKGSLNVLLRDTAFAADLKGGMESIRKASSGFDDNMRAIKHSFLFRGYFRKAERQAKIDSIAKAKLKR